MKLLGWMHRRLRQNNNDVFKEFTTSGGGSCNSITRLASPDPVTFLASANGYFSDDAFDTNHPPLPDNSTDLFIFGGSGLLTIGTLGIGAVTVPGDEDEEDDYRDVDVDANNNDANTKELDDVDGAATPTFTNPPPPEAAAVEKAVVAVEAIAEKDDNTTTEDDLMVVSAELEKVLGGRNSGAAGEFVASARASFATGVDCPLQGFLFGSSVRDAESRQERRESLGGGRRTSLGELFLRTRFADEKVTLVDVEEGEDRKAHGEEGKDGKGDGGGKVMKMKVKDEKSAGGDGAPASANKSKFQKILQIFHRKVYPESTALARSLTKKSRKRVDTGREAPGSAKLQCRKEPRLPGFGCCANRSSFGGSASPDVDDEHNGSKSGHWIRTDADYLVLVL